MGGTYAATTLKGFVPWWEPDVEQMSDYDTELVQ